LLQDAGRVSVGFSDGSAGEYELLVGADGIDSTSRGLTLTSAGPSDLGAMNWRRLKHGSIGQCGGGKKTTFLIARKRDDVVDRVLGYPHADRRYMKGKLRGCGKIERARHRWRSEKAIKGIIACDPNPLNSYIVAAGSPQA
jgi:hypothetical protein